MQICTLHNGSFVAVIKRQKTNTEQGFWTSSKSDERTYRRPLFFAGLLFAVLTVHGPWIVTKFVIPGHFPRLSADFGPLNAKKGIKRHTKAKNWGPSLSAVLVFAGYSWDVTPENNKARLCFCCFSFNNILEPTITILVVMIFVLTCLLFTNSVIAINFCKLLEL